MKSLIVDTATSYLTIYLYEDEELKYALNEDYGKKLSVTFLPKLKEALTSLNWQIRDLNRIYVSVGPGSFTGIRIGLTDMKTIAWALNIPIWPISSLELMASGFDNDFIVPLIDARNDNVYAAVYDKDLNIVLEEKFYSLAELKQNIATKELVFTSYDTFDFKVQKPKIDGLKIIRKYQNLKPVNPHTLKPNYLKLTAAEVNLKEKANDSRS